MVFRLYLLSSFHQVRACRSSALALVSFSVKSILGQSWRQFMDFIVFKLVDPAKHSTI